MVPFALLVASGSIGIDTQVALKLAKEYPIGLIVHRRDDGTKIIDAVKAQGGEAELFVAGTLSNDVLTDTVASIKQQFGDACTVAVYQPQQDPAATPFLQKTSQDLQRESVAPIEGAYAFAQHVLPLLSRASDGTHPPTLLFSSSSGNSYHQVVNENALVALSRSLGRELGPKGVHVSHVKIKEASGAEAADKASTALVAETFWYLHTQPLSCLSNEMSIYVTNL